MRGPGATVEKETVEAPSLHHLQRDGRVNYSVKGKVNGVLFRNLRSLQSDPAYGEVFIGCEGCSTYSGYPYWIP
ncbi:MAG: hypothetical protein RXR39_05340, partial [Caldivirga sp.]